MPFGLCIYKINYVPATKTCSIDTLPPPSYTNTHTHHTHTYTHTHTHTHTHTTDIHTLTLTPTHTDPRFRPLSLELPQPLFPIAGVPLLQHHIESCTKVKHDRLCVCVCVCVCGCECACVYSCVMMAKISSPKAHTV